MLKSMPLLLSIPRSMLLRSMHQSLFRLLSEIRPLATPTQRVISRIRTVIERFGRLPEPMQVRFLAALKTFGYCAAALDWFDEQAQDPDLMRRRGLRPAEPLPRDLGIFDDTGRIGEQLSRESLVQLRTWLNNDDRVLGWFFPEGLSPEDDKDLREQLHILHHYERPDGGRGQPWSPIAALDAVLADWPEDLPTREVSLAAAERDLIEILDELFPEEQPGES
jgi:hypothetical protein